MHDSRTMRVFESDQDAVDDPACLRRVERAPGDDVFEQAPVDVLHDDERDLDLMTGGIPHGLFAGIEHPHDRGMSHARGGLSLLPEARAEGGIVGERRLQQLDRDAAAEASVHADVHVGHAAAAEQLADLVAAGEQTNICCHPFCHDPPLLHLLKLRAVSSVLSA